MSKNKDNSIKDSDTKKEEKITDLVEEKVITPEVEVNNEVIVDMAYQD